MEEKKCELCGISFVPRSPIQKFCSFECREDSQSARRKKPVYTDPTAKFKPVLEFMRLYYESTGKYIQYGEAVTLMEQQKKGRAKWKR
jgi:hypothetical protein